jgi:hypothetical protein
MRTRLTVVLLAGAIGLSCSSSSSAPTSSTAAAISVRAPASVAARVCTRCADLVGELEVAVDLVVEETAGVGGQITGINVVLSSGSTPIVGPALFDVATILRFGTPTNRINARGSLTLPQIGVHFEPSLRERLPGTLRFTVMFQDDGGHSTSADAVIQVTP